MGRNIPESYDFHYQLSYDELYEAFYLLAFRWSRRFRIASGLALIAVTAVMLVSFCLDPRKVHLFYIAILAILLLFYLIYMPHLKARKGARQVTGKGASFQVRLSGDGRIHVPGGSFSLAGDKSARALETDRLFVIRADQTQSLCLPKRIMKADEIDGVRKLLSKYLKVLPR